MKQFTTFFFIIGFAFSASCQNFHLILNGSTTIEKRLIDSITYQKKHKEAKSVNDEVNKVSDKLSKIGYIENQLIHFAKKNDTTYVGEFSIGEQIKYVHIHLKHIPKQNDIISLVEKDSLIIPYIEIEDFLSQTLKKAEQKGFALTKLNLSKIQKKGTILYAELELKTDNERTINTIVAKYAEENRKAELPKGHLKQINSKYNKQIFNKNTIQKIHKDFEKFRFVNQIKYPEILLLKDSTKVYVYLEKRKSNNFDGFVGFTTNENSKVIFSGYLDLTLENTLKAGEQFSLYWKSDGNDQKTFRTNLEVPYIFNSNIGIKAQINIFKQDSIFQNTKTSFDLGYLVNYNTRIYLGYQATESSDIQNTNSNNIQDYKNSFITSKLEYSKFDYDIPLFPDKTKIRFTTGFGKRTNNTAFVSESNKQYYIDLNASHTIEINNKNHFNINSQNFYLNSNNFLVNELFRFGGTNSIRGFAENSLQAEYMSAIMTEYRFIASPNLYLHSIIDYSIYKDPFSTLKKIETLTGIGIGIGLQTKNGLLKLTLANGIDKNQKTDINNTIISLKFNITF
ncbi:BamA/TamA family outer membrane protein [Flavobacterium sp. NG2]|uniref:BamA/TamA family outer membrane protein n=1 Tax=Flavobacterium sp. NG2 TaxID=3097547 RepID=UPI002A7ED18C|nr:BamA/TamA family outer membrane protein [Flavobacterium sp. NG2]WPR71703.1 BamA/TamA family outer membrane protein [Flavobacterium sp. NG2]